MRCSTCGFDFDALRHRGVCPRCALQGCAAPMPSEEAPRRIGDFELVEPIGRGGMGAVWLARQVSLDRFVAVKLIPPASGPDAALLEERLLREGRAVARLKHPAVVSVLEVGRAPDGAAYLAMEFFEGGDLAARLRRRPLAARDAAGFAERLAQALAHAHAEGVLHRDIKPSNILLDAEGRPCLADFGLAAVAGAARDLTRPEQVAGTPAYLAPELLGLGGVPTAAADVYALGAVLYEMLAGRAPFHGDSPATIIASVLHDEPPAPRTLNRSVPRDLETICLKCLEKNPAARYATAAALAEDLAFFRLGRPIRARPVSPAGRLVRWARRNPALATVSAALLFALVGGAAVLAQRNVALRSALGRAQVAETEAREQLRGALLTQARSLRLSGQRGQRTGSVEALARAAEIRPGRDLRNEAAAALALPDWTQTSVAGAWSGETIAAVPDAKFEHVFVEQKGRWSWRAFPTGDELWTVSASAESASAVVVSPDARWVALRLRDDTVHVLETARGTEVLRLERRPYAFKESVWQYGRDMDFSADGNLFAVTRREGGVTFHALPGGEVVGAWNSAEWVTSIAFSPDGKRLAAGGSRERGTNLLAVVEAPGGREVWREPAVGRVEFVAWSTDGELLASRETEGVVQVRTVRDRRVRSVVPDRDALYAKFLPDGGGLLLAEQLARTRLWEPLSGRLMALRDDEGRPGTWFTPDGRRQWRSFSAGPVFVAELTPSPVVQVVRIPWLSGQVAQRAWPLDVSPDGRWLLIGARGGVTVFDLQRWRVAGGANLPDPNCGEVAARFEADGETVWVAGLGAPLRRGRFTVKPDGSAGLVFESAGNGPGDLLIAAAHRETGRLALSAPERGEVQVFDCASGAVVAKWEHGAATRASFSPDGTQLAVASAKLMRAEARTAVYRVADGTLVAAIGSVGGNQVRWSVDGRWIFTGGETDPAVWSAPAQVKDLRAQVIAGSARSSGDVSPDGRWLAVRSSEGIALLETETGAELVELRHPALLGWTSEIRFTPDGRRLLAIGLNGVLFSWDLAALRGELAGVKLDW